MKRPLVVALVLVAVAVAFLVASMMARAAPKEGDTAPEPDSKRGNVGSGGAALGGAAAGAAIGAAGGPVGVAVGAAVGALVGFLGGKDDIANADPSTAEGKKLAAMDKNGDGYVSGADRLWWAFLSKDKKAARLAGVS